MKSGKMKPFYNGPAKPGKNPPVNPKVTSHTPHAKAQGTVSLAPKPGLHARVKAGLAKAFPASPAPASTKANTAKTPITKGAY